MWRRIGLIALLLATGFLVVVPAGEGSTAATPRCLASQFKLSRGPMAAALSHYRQTVRLRNVSHATCSMSGWFKVQLLAANGSVLSSHEEHVTSDMFGTSPKPTVVVSPGGGASFAIDTRAPATSCPYSRSVAVTPPGAHGSRTVSLRVLACPKFSVLPVQPDNKAIHP
jgi:hypothetical protein